MQNEHSINYEVELLQSTDYRYADTSCNILTINFYLFVETSAAKGAGHLQADKIKCNEHAKQ